MAEALTGLSAGNAEALLLVRDLSKRFALARGEHFYAVDQVSLQLYPGEVLGLVGESGSGKSTLARMLVGLEDKSAGSVLFAGRQLAQRYRRADFRAQARDIQMVFQDPASCLNPRLSVAEIIAEPLRLLGQRGDLRAQVEQALQRVRLPLAAMGRYVHEFSGGQRQRIGIARALIGEPRLLVCDEPISALDVSVQAQVINLLAQLRRELQLSILFIAHDLAMVRYLCDRVAVMYRGRVVEQAACEQLFARPQHPYTQSLLAASPLPDPAYERARRLTAAEAAARSAPPSPMPEAGACGYAARCRWASAQCRQQAPPLVSSGEGAAVACWQRPQG